MAFMRQGTIFLLTMQICSTTTTFGEPSIRPDGTCHYQRYFWNRMMFSESSCARYTCDGRRKQLSIETCNKASHSTVQSGSGEMTSSHGHRRFPSCCPLEQEDGLSFYSYKSTTYHLGHARGKTESLNREYINVTREISCKMTVSGEGKERGLHQASSCCKITYNREEGTATLTWCPVLIEDMGSQCALVSKGETNAIYPQCCREYLCPPAQRYCSCGKKEEDEDDCSYKDCAEKDQSDGSQTCISKSDLSKRGCKDVQSSCALLQSERFGTSSKGKDTCPDLMCPNVTEHKFTVDARRVYVDALIEVHKTRKKFCKYNGTEFENSFKSTNPCEQWTCDFARGKVGIKRCSRSNLMEHCKWSGGDHTKPFPECCPPRRCEGHYTRYTHYV